MGSVITSRSNGRVRHIRLLMRERAYREQHRQFAAEGVVMLNEAIRSGAEVNSVMYDSLHTGVVKEYAGILENAEFIEVAPDILEFISSVETPQGVVFSCAMESKAPPFDPHGKTIVLDCLADPGNLGTILRTADAFAIDNVVLCGKCADIYSPKTVRASMGAVFRQNVFFMDYGTLEQEFHSKGFKIYAAALGGNPSDIRTVNLENLAVAIGNEAHGVSQNLLDIADANVIIPMFGQAESLNAAAAASVVMWEMARR